VTTDAPPAEPATPSTPETPATDRLPDDHPAVKALAKANDEAKTLRLRLQEIEDRDKSDLQKAQEALDEKDKALTDLPKQVRRQVLKFASAASTKGFLDPEDALTFLSDDIDLDDSDAVNKALDELAERKPHLTRKPKTPTRPKPATGARADDDGDGAKGKERAAAALRQLRTP
jgi:hypothetical protein